MPGEPISSEMKQIAVHAFGRAFIDLLNEVAIMASIHPRKTAHGVVYHARVRIWAATIILSGVTTIILSGGEESKAA